eukprot:gene16054-7400_t
MRNRRELQSQSQRNGKQNIRESQYFLQTVKCTDEACCSPFQSSYLKIKKDPFLPPPVPVVYSQNGAFEWAKDDKEASYLYLFQNIALNASLKPKHPIMKFPKGIPYDYSCPSTKDTTQHTAEQRIRYQLPTEPRGKVRPQRVAARRQNELLCAMAFQGLERHEIDDVDFDDESDIQRLFPKVEPPFLMIWIQSGQVIDQL